jgi:phosphodiesterase/alkaline phosphatase D-like protein
LGFSSCAKSGSNSEAFLELYNHNVDLFINTGDLHYEDIAVNDLAKFDIGKHVCVPHSELTVAKFCRFNAGFDMVFDHANPKNFYRSVAMDYVYDDHDFGPNNADGESPSRVRVYNTCLKYNVVGGTNHERTLQPAAQTAYRLNFPHYNLPNTTADGLGAVYHTFSVGRVKFIVIDTRAEQFRAIPQIISPHQMAWLKNELNDFASWGLVVLVSSQPWIGAAEPGVSQAWNGYPAQREELANHIATIGVNNMIFIAGDAHMVRPQRHSFDSSELLNLTCLLSRVVGL